MHRSRRTSAAWLGTILLACTACSAPISSVAGTPPASTAQSAAQSAPQSAVICEGENGQDLDVPEPAKSFGLAWNESDEQARLEILSRIWSEETTHVQPEMDVRLVGREFSDHIGAFRANRPGEYFEWRGWDAGNLHHDRVLMPWRLCSADGGVLLEGTDFGVIGPDGRFMETTGFYPPE